MAQKDYEKNFSHFKTVEPPAGLFDRIILAIKREREKRQTGRLLFGFFSLLVISFISLPFSCILLIKQAGSSGVIYFISVALGNLGTFFALWQSFILAILESLPLAGLAAFTASLAISVFTLRLFLYKNRLLWRYLTHSFA